MNVSHDPISSRPQEFGYFSDRKIHPHAHIISARAVELPADDAASERDSLDFLLEGSR